MYPKVPAPLIQNAILHDSRANPSSLHFKKLRAQCRIN